MLINGIGEQSALIEANVSGRRTNQPRDRVPLHVLGHLEAGEFGICTDIDQGVTEAKQL